MIRLVQVKLGQDVTLPSQAGDVTIRAVKWTRSEPEPPKDILIYRVGIPIKGRVQLVDDKLKTGDVSLILKDVKRDDSGTYECRVITTGTESKPISIVQLQVTDPGELVEQCVCVWISCSLMC